MKVIAPCHIFPFEKIDKGEEIIIWGNGVVGKQYMEQIRQTNYCKVICVVDRNWKEQKSSFYCIEDPIIITKNTNCKILIAQWDYSVFLQIKQHLLKLGIHENRIIHTTYIINCEISVDRVITSNFDVQNKALEKNIKAVESIQKNTDQGLKTISEIKQTLVKMTCSEDLYTCGMPFYIKNSKERLSEFEKLNNKFREIGENSTNDQTRVVFLMENLERTLHECKGDVAEVGVYRGSTAQILKHYCEKYKRELYLFDTFEGFDDSDLVGIDECKKKFYVDNSLEYVKKNVGTEKWIHYKKGYFPDTIDDTVRNRMYSFIHLDCDLYQPIYAGLEFFWDRMCKGGIIAVHDYASGFWAGATNAVDDFCASRNITKVLIPDLSGTVIICK